MPVKTFIPPILAVAALTAFSYGTPSGLNNIPTADTTPQGTFVLQAFSTIGNDRTDDFNLGFKTGIDAKFVKFEIGADSHLYPGKGGPVVVQGKMAIPFGEGLPTLALGAANISFTNEQRARVGDGFAYGVVTQDFGWLRIHGGCGMQDGIALPFYGVDKTFRYTKSVPTADGKSVADGKSTRDGKSSRDGKSQPSLDTRTIDLFTLRADAIEQPDSSWLYSAGVLVPVCKWFVLEAWGNFPDNGSDASVTLKANFVITF